MIFYKIVIGGNDISIRFNPILESITVTDGSDNEADTCSIVLDDSNGQTFLSKKRDEVQVYLGESAQTIGLVFEGTVDDVRSAGSRTKGRTLEISCKSVDFGGKAKEPQERHWEDKTLEDILTDAFEPLGIDLAISKEFASMTREYEAMDGEDALTFAARIAKEVGATFKMMGKRAVFVKRNSGQNAVGQSIPPFVAEWGVNLIEWNLQPIISRASFGSFVSRYFDFDNNRLEESVKESKGEAKHLKTSHKASKSHAESITESDMTEADRKASDGSIKVTGSCRPQADGECRVIGLREGVDGLYIIESVEHSASRNNGYTCTLTLRRPSGGAGVDKRGNEDATDT